MTIVAILCSGQGTQHREMFSLVESDPCAEPVFQAARTLLGADPRAFVRTAPMEQLFSNRTGQILCCTMALAAHAALGPIDARIVCAGYSVGELAAWGVSGCLKPEQVLKLAATRADLMDAASPPDAGLAGIVGLQPDRLERILTEAGLFIAIKSAAENVVIGGPVSELDDALALAMQQGASVARRLRVSVPSHTPLLRSAVQPLKQAIVELQPKAPHTGLRLLSGLDGEPILRPADGCERLARQVAETVRWDACLQGCRESDAQVILELGPGSALTRMARAALPDIPARSIDDFHGMEGVRQWLLRAP
ncbi:acyl transferase domain-containing protein [Acetobacter nitrogenifigens DSM 23921 = NBRC 105050]|uniref:Malonate decarboxylase subunit epsilon n=1 Tax=Acetobacter nitrogenifigens DSM 23921 = NBRC 105050 TaxID=1120919 RepID=A0A511X5U2_9PROT|nr:malonate decarboxylase subunit epsilon [Acetobacter nitrogenifigens]GBQ98556.1 acyl transferase domain-containing protein [Acetobacter nitrogenifigens DSM 23921 = NBRC 105050]GEN58317.1 malonate decarboxylase subunit epsilon [Acetobacter nitrogenifigens DSM 23921 = NBRC 105050]